MKKKRQTDEKFSYYRYLKLREKSSKENNELKNQIEILKELLNDKRKIIKILESKK